MNLLNSLDRALCSVPRAAMALLASSTVALAGCQILGIGAIPCDDNDQCPAGFTCNVGDGICVTKNAPPIPPEEIPQEGPLRPVEDGCDRTVREAGASNITVEVTEERGSAALRTAPGFDADLVFSVLPAECPRANTAGCNFQGDAQLVSVPQPVALVDGQSADDVRLTLFRNARALDAPSREQLEQPFVVEAVFQVPAPDPGSPNGRVIFGQAGDQAPVFGWGVFSAPESIFFFAGGVAVFVGDPGDQAWVHLLCFVDGSELSRAPVNEAVVCAVDGLADDSGGAFEVVSNVRGTVEGADLTFDDVALASLRVWVAAEVPSDIVARNDLIFERGRSRLLAFTGVHLGGDQRTLALGDGFSAGGVKLFPLLDASGVSERDGYVRVGKRWPRVASTPQGLALMLEPARDNLFSNDTLANACAPLIDRRSEPVAAPLRTACEPPGPLVLAAEAPAPVEGDPSVTFSVFGDETGNGSPVLQADLRLSNNSITSCDFLDGARLCADGTPFFLAETADTFQRYSVTIEPPAGVSVTEVTLVTTEMVVWAPQLEAGSFATSPIVATPPVLADPSLPARTPDAVSLQLGDVGAAEQVVLRARISGLGARGTASFFSVVESLGAGAGLAALSVDREAGPLAVFASTAEPDLTVEQIPAPAGDVVVGATFGEGATCADCDVQAHVAERAAFDTQLLALGADGPPLLLHEASLQSSAGGGLGDRPMRLAVEPRTVGCTFVGDAPLFDASDEGCDDGYCARDGRVWVGDPDRIFGPNVGDLAFGGSATESFEGHTADANLIVEARFRVDGDGEALALRDVGGNTVLTIGAAGGDLLLSAGGESGTLSAAADAWVHVTCWLGAQSAGCLRNLAVLRADGTTNEGGFVNLGAGHGGAVVSSVTLAGEVGPLSIARAFSVPSTEGTPDEQRDVGLFLALDRAMRAFGLHANPRPQFVFASALQDDVRIIERAIEDRRLPFVVSPGWVHVVLDKGPALMLEPAVDDPLSDTLTSWSGAAGLASATGPAGLPAVVLPDGAAISLDETLGGVVSIYARTRSGAPVFTLDVGGTRRSAKTSAPVYDSNLIDAGDGWVRLFVSSLEQDGRVTLSVKDGDVELAAPQLDRGGHLTAPARNDTRGHERVGLFTGELNLGALAATMSFDVTPEGDGVFASLLAYLNFGTEAAPFEAFQGFSVGVQGTDLLVVSAALSSTLEPITLPVQSLSAPFPTLDPRLPITIALREFDLLVRAGPRAERAFMIPPFAGASLLLLGNVGDDDTTTARIRTLRSSDELQ